MLGGWKQTIRASIPRQYHQTIDHQGVSYGKIILIDDIKETKKFRVVKTNRKCCQAICKNGKPCVHLPTKMQNFCKRHLKIGSEI